MKKIKQIIKNNNIISLSGFSLLALLYALSIFILARTYSKEQFGKWMIFLETAFLMQMLMNGLFSSALIKFLSSIKLKKDKDELIGSNWIISIIITLIIVFIIYLVLIIFNEKIINSNFKFFFYYYPLLSLSILPMHNAITIFQADKLFLNLFIIRLFQMLFFVIFITINYFILKTDIHIIVLIYILSILLSSILSLVTKSSKISLIRKFNKNKIMMLLNFSKYTTGTYIGGNLLKSSDIFIIGLLMEATDVAIYSIPLKLIDIINIPLHSFALVAYPKISYQSETNMNEVKYIFYNYSGFISIILLPILLVLLIFSKELIVLVGGIQYINNNIAKNIFRVFIIYGFFLTIDRFTGITLDSINKPKYNFLKVSIMVFFNVIGDIIVIKLYNSIVAVSIVTLINGILGIFLGIYFLKKEINVKFFEIFTKLDFKKLLNLLFIKN